MLVYSLKQARLLAGKTQQETAEHLGIHVQTYMKIERNPESATMEQARKLVDFFGRTVDEVGFICPETQQSVETGEKP